MIATDIGKDFDPMIHEETLLGIDCPECGADVKNGDNLFRHDVGYGPLPSFNMTKEEVTEHREKWPIEHNINMLVGDWTCDNGHTFNTGVHHGCICGWRADER